MTGQRIRFAVSLALFLGWIGWLAYLALATSRPTVLSRPQFLVSRLDIIAQVDEKDGHADPQVRVRDVHWPPDEQKLVNKRLTVTNLAECTPWNGAGLYILPLVKDGANWRVADIPSSPGFETARGLHRPRIYPETSATLYQLSTIEKPARDETGSDAPHRQREHQSRDREDQGDERGDS